MLKRYVGDRAFYSRTLAIALPIIIQNLITNFVSLLDNIMVGQLSTAEIGAVTIANNNLLFIFNLCLFGGAAGAGIFTTQFHGSGNHEGVRHTFRFKMYICIGLAAIGAAIFYFAGTPLINLYLLGEGDPVLASETLRHGQDYLRTMLWGMLPFALSNAYASTLRETEHPTVPMVAGLAAMVVNLALNYMLIFGHFGAPAMGVTGAAIATVIARYAELLIIVAWTHLNPRKNPFVRGVYRSLYIPGKLLKSVAVKGILLMLNEGFWSLGMAVLNQSYSVCGLDVTPALSITYTICNLTAVIFRSLGNTVGIITGQMLGSSCPEEEVRDSNRKLSALCVFSGVLVGVITAVLAGVFPNIYNTTTEIRQLAAMFILISAFNMPMQAYIFPVYFTLRAGGKALATFVFDSGAVWVTCIPLAFILSHYTSVSILVIFALCNSIDLLRCAIGYLLIRKGNWIQNLTAK